MTDIFSVKYDVATGETFIQYSEAGKVQAPTSIGKPTPASTRVATATHSSLQRIKDSQPGKTINTGTLQGI